MTGTPRIGVMGGTFDPIHAGHVAAAFGAERALGLEQILLIPSSLPPHRSDRPRVGPYHRFAMVALAAAPHAHWTVSDAELERAGPSFSYDTLAGLAQSGVTASQIFFIIGTDAFAEIATWSRYPAVLDLAHFAVVARPGMTVDALRQRLPALADRMVTPDTLPDGGPGTRIILVTAETPDVSSTAIRARAATDQPIAGLVPAAVASYIARHGLYGPHSQRAFPSVGR